jgi:FkbM family methyltransferase
MKIGNRRLSTIAGALLQRRHYQALYNMLRFADFPTRRLRQYLFKVGHYPQPVTVKTPQGPLALSLYSHDDLLTVNEIFFRNDYAVTEPEDVRVIVDFGSNIGVSAAYFLTYHPEAFAYLFEPLPKNIARLRDQLRAFTPRFQLSTNAVSTATGMARFGWESTGRYGGVGRQTGNYIDVECVSANDVLRSIIDRHGQIDILKIDIETMERQLVQNLPTDIITRIRTIFVETAFPRNPHPATHSYHRRGPITTLRRRPDRP